MQGYLLAHILANALIQVLASDTARVQSVRRTALPDQREELADVQVWINFQAPKQVVADAGDQTMAGRAEQTEPLGMSSGLGQTHVPGPFLF